jgi:hypothetical protein
MDIQHVNVKLFVERPERIDMSSYLTVFMEWIQEQPFDELLIDVADYRHVPNGPGVILVGHEASYSMDHTGGRLGLLYNRKSPMAGSVQSRIQQAIQAVLNAAERLQSHPSQLDALKFDFRSIQFILNDRLLAPNTKETYLAFTDALRPVLGERYVSCEVEQVSSDPRERLAVLATSPQPIKNISVFAG